MNKKHAIAYFFGLMAMVAILFTGNGCKHMPNMVDDPFIPVDTMDNPVDTMVVDPDTTVMDNPCDPDIVYFERDILPLLISNCTTSGCHNADDAADGVVLVDYTQTIQTADVRPFDLQGSDLYEVITEDDPDKVMPRPPNAPLSNAQVALIAQWILQGAEDLSCDEDVSSCDTIDVSFMTQVAPIIEANCRGCHSGPNPSGGIDLTTHAGISAQASNGLLYGVIERLPGFSPMPQGTAKLPQCEIDQIKSWIDAGAPNN